MRQLIYLVLLLLYSWFSIANDDALFEDASLSELADVPIEVDESIDDSDFSHIEDSKTITNSADAGPGSLITNIHEPFLERDLIRKEKSLSLFGGNETIAQTYYFTLFPQGRFSVWNIYGHLGLPLRFPVYDNLSQSGQGQRTAGFVTAKSFITPRPQDFQSFWDIQRVVRHVEYGRPQDPYFLRLSRSHALTLSHGELVKDLNPVGFSDQDLMLLSGHAELDYARIEAFLGPMLKAEMLGLSMRIAPLNSLDAPPWVRNLNFDATYVNDFFAPNLSKKQDDYFVLDSEKRMVERNRGTAQGFVLGVAGEFHPLPWLSLKPYTSYGHLWLTGLKDLSGDSSSSYGGALHLGHDAMIFFNPGSKVSVLVFRTEGRLFSKGYFPSYFGSTYFLDRAVVNEDGNAPLTKSESLAEGGDGRFRFGYLFELGYAYDQIVSTSIGYENARSFGDGKSIPSLRKLQFLTSFLGLEVIKFHLGYHGRSLAQMDELFEFEKSGSLLSLRGQLKLMPTLYFDAWVKHAFGINDMFNEGSEPIWLSSLAETRSLNFGLGLEFAMRF